MIATLAHWVVTADVIPFRIATRWIGDHATAAAAAGTATTLAAVAVKAAGWIRQPSTADYEAIEAGLTPPTDSLRKEPPAMFTLTAAAGSTDYAADAARQHANALACQQAGNQSGYDAWKTLAAYSASKAYELAA